MEQQQMDLFEDGGLRDQGGGKDPVSGNNVPIGSLEKEVRDDIPAMLSEGEFIFPADVVRYWGLDLLMQMRQEAKQGLKKMEDMGQMGNSEEATLPDDMPFNMDDIETGDEPAFKFNVGGLAADPRFATQNVTVPTYTEEDKKNIETAVLSGVFGDITMKRYVNAEGKVIYIPFIGDKPQAPIPEGYSLDESPVVSSPSTTGQAITDSGGGGSTYDPTLSPLDRALQQPDMSTVKSIDINKMTPEELVAYYESFTSPMAKFASYGAGLLFGPLIGAGVALAQQWSIRNGPNSFVNTEKRLAELISTGELKDAGLMKRINVARKRAKENGVGPVSLLSKIGEKLGLSKGPNADILTKDLANAIKNGVLPKNAKEIFNQTDAITEAFKDIDPETKKLIDQYTGGRGVPGESMLYGRGFEPKDIGTDPSNILRPTNFNYGDVPEFDVGQPAQAAEVNPFDRGFTPETIGTDPSISSEEVLNNARKARQDAEKVIQKADEISAKARKDRKEKDAKAALERLQPGVKQPRVIEKRSKEDEALVADQSIPDFFGENFGSSDEDRQGGDVSSLGGSPFDNTASSTTGIGGGGSTAQTRTTTNYGYTPTTKDPYEASQDMGAFFKKGGLAKPKVKPKKMKKGGLASLKKKK